MKRSQFFGKLEKKVWDQWFIGFFTGKTETDERRNSSRNPGVPSTPEAYFIMDESIEIFARKVFVGGLPIDVTEGDDKYLLFFNWDLHILNENKDFVSLWTKT